MTKNEIRPDAINILRRPAELRRTLTALLERRFDCLAQCERVTARYGNVRVSGTRDRGDGPALALADLDTRIRKCYQAIAAAECAADDFLRELASAPDRDVRSIRRYRREALLLRLRYRDNLSMADVRAELAKRGYMATDRAVRNWHRAALARAGQIRAPQPEPKEGNINGSGKSDSSNRTGGTGL